MMYISGTLSIQASTGAIVSIFVWCTVGLFNVHSRYTEYTYLGGHCISALCTVGQYDVYLRFTYM